MPSQVTLQVVHAYPVQHRIQSAEEFWDRHIDVFHGRCVNFFEIVLKSEVGSKCLKCADSHFVAEKIRISSCYPVHRAFRKSRLNLHHGFCLRICFRWCNSNQLKHLGDMPHIFLPKRFFFRIHIVTFIWQAKSTLVQERHVHRRIIIVRAWPE